MELREWTMKVPWGTIALISYGNPDGEPVLLVHGRLDSAATFIPLLKLLPSRFNYVLVDLPGNGKSDPFPQGTMLTRFLGVAMIDIVVKHLGWKEFTYIGHSLGAEQGLFYAAIYPKLVKRAIYLDPGPSIVHCYPLEFPRFFKDNYESFYDSYHKYDYDREYTKEQAIRAVRNARSLNEAEAEIILSRCLVEIGPDTYKLSWDRRYKTLPGFNSLPVEFYHDLFSLHTTPSLFICANSLKNIFYRPKSLAYRLMSTLTEKSRNVKVLYVDGSHDVHLTNPERFIDELLTFLETDFVVSKL